MEWKEAGLGRKKHGRNAVSVKSSWPQREHCSWDDASELSKLGWGSWAFVPTLNSHYMWVSPGRRCDLATAVCSVKATLKQGWQLRSIYWPHSQLLRKFFVPEEGSGWHIVACPPHLHFGSQKQPSYWSPWAPSPLPTLIHFHTAIPMNL